MADMAVGGLERIPAVIGTPWTGCQSITGPHRDKRDTQPCMLTLTPEGNLDSPKKL